MDQIENTEVAEENEISADTSGMVQAKEPETPEEPDDGQGKAVGYRLLAALVALLSIGGLFLGLLGSKVAALAPVLYFQTYTVGKLEGSLIGYVIGYLQFLFRDGGFSAMFQSGIAVALSSVVDMLLLAGLAVSVVFSVVAFIVALAAKKKAKGFALASGIITFLVYVGFFLWSYFGMGSLQMSAKLSSDVCDVPTAIIAGVVLLLIAVTAIASNKYGIANVLLLLCTVAVAFVVSYPAALTVRATQGIFDFGSNAFVKIALLFFLIAIAFNVVMSAARVGAKRGYPFECIRFALLLLGAILAVVAFIATPLDAQNRWEIFKGSQLICSVAFLVLSVLAFIIAVIMAAITRGGDKDEVEEAKTAGELSDDGHTEVAQVASYDAENGNAEAAAVVPASAETAAEEPEAVADEEPFSAAIPHAAPYPEPVEEKKAEPEPEPVRPEPAAPAPEPAAPMAPPAAAYEPAPAAPAPSYYAPYTPRPQPPVREEAPISEFERRMEALARGEQPEYAPPQSAPQPPQQPQVPLQQQPPQQPYMPPMARVGAASTMQRPSGYADANQYTYDPFINSLSPQEKNEFGDLFIACKSGKVEGLPTYSIGGDNTEFFRKVFIYLGKFRKDISTELLDKLYQFVSRTL